MDLETRELLDSLMYDVGQLPYRFMREEPAARAAYNSWEKLKARLEVLDDQTGNKD